MINPQEYAVSIEQILRTVFKCERFGFGGVVDSDFIRKQPLAAMLSGLGYLHANSDSEKRKEIEVFIVENSCYLEMSLDELLSFENSIKVHGVKEMHIEYENGIKALESIIEKFRVICR